MKNFLRRLCVVVLTLAMCLPTLPMTVYAASGQPPAHSKTVTANEDGSFTIALDVTGDSEKQVSKVNVIVIVDRSGSMGFQSGTSGVTYTSTNQNGDNLYGRIDGEYVPLTHETSGWGMWTTHTYYLEDGTEYTGTRYRRTDGNLTRLQATKNAVTSLANSLLSNNGGDNPSDTVQMALVSFSYTGRVDVDPTTSDSTFLDGLDEVSANGGTNWESALRTAYNISFNDNDPTYVIFFSDGAPTNYDNSNHTNYTGTGQEEEPNMGNSYDAAKDDAKTLAEKVGVKNFYTIFAYGSDEGKAYMTSLTSDAGAPEGNNYSAANTAELEDAFAAILSEIEMAGIGSVEITDGTTTSLSSGGYDLSLITIDESSYKYYRKGGKYSSEGLGDEWTDAPEAVLTNGAVVWDLAKEGVLENGVVYTVTFTAWPSQQALDLTADIKNDPSAYNKIPAALQQYFSANGDIKTNTTATISYTDTRTGETTTQAFNPVEPQKSESVQSLAITKDWSNILDPESAKIPTSVAIYVNRDDVPTYEVTLKESNGWKNSAYISIGVMTVDRTTGTVEVKATGHDFKFSEEDAVSYNWEIVAPTVHPMKINGTTYNLILQEEAVSGDNGKMYQKIGTDEYYRLTSGGALYKAEEIASGAAVAELNAVNERRSYFNLTKKVEGDADPDDLFKFELTVDDLDVTAPTADDDAWFSVWDNNIGGLVTDLDTNATPESNPSNGYYHFTDGGTVYVMMKAGQNLRVLNTKTNTQITVNEILTDGGAYTVKSMELKKRAGKETSETLVTSSALAKNTIMIEETNTAYTMTYTNDYGLGALKITKTVEGVSMSAISSDAAFTVTGPDSYTKTVLFSDFEANPSDAAVKSYTVYDLEPGKTYNVSEAGFGVADYKLTTTGLGSGQQIEKGKTAEFDVKNTYTRETGSLTITKTVEGLDADANAPEFKFTVAGDELTTETSITLAQSATSGSITISDLPTGVYTVTEDTSNIDVPNYTRDTTNSAVEDTATVTVTGSAVAEIKNVYSKDMGTLKITKIVKGITPNDYTATFEVKDADGETVTVQSISWPARRALPVEDVVTSDSAVITLPVGTYIVTETSATAVDGYVYTYEPSGKTTDAAVSKGIETEVTFTNIYAREAGSLTISKKFTGLAEGTTLPAVEFVISGPSGYSTTVAFSDFTDGSLTITNLPSGDYTVTETTSKALVEGYDLVEVKAAETTTVAVAEGGEAKVDFENVYEVGEGTLTITKTVKGVTLDQAKGITFTVSGTTIKGETLTTSATFENFEEASKAAAKPMLRGAVAPLDPTNDGGTKSFTFMLPVGTYSVTESGNDIDGYELTAIPTTGAIEGIEITNGGAASAEFSNTYGRLAGVLTINKTLVGLDEGTTVGAIQFTVEAATTGSSFATTTVAVEFAEGATTGSIEIKNVPTGKYIVTEVTSSAVVPGYYPPTTEEAKTVEIIEEDAEVSFTNTYTKKEGSLVIEKTDKQGLTPKTATFTLTGDGVGFETVTVSYGAFTNGRYSLTVPVGKYTLTETGAAVKGYDLEATYVGDETGNDYATTAVVEGATEPAIIGVENSYDKQVGSLTIEKVLKGADKSQLPDLTFIVESVETVSGEEYSTKIAFSELATKAAVIEAKAARLNPIPVDGSKDNTYTITIPNVPIGSYTVSETGTAIDGYFLSDGSAGAEASVTTGSATIEIDTNKTVTLKNIYQQLGDDLTITKTVTGLLNGEKIPAFKFEVTNGKGDVVTTVSIEDLKLGEAKSVTVKDLPADTYTVTELASGTAIEGYTLDIPTPQAIEISEESDVRVASFTNEYKRITGTLTISKSYTGLKGMVPEIIITVTTESEDFGNGGELELSYYDLENGKYTTTAPFGEYTISEDVSDPDGYTWLEKESTTSAIAKIVENGDKAELALYNKYEPDLATLVITKTIIGLDAEDYPKDLSFIVTGKLDSGAEDYSTIVAFADFTELTKSRDVKHLNPDESKTVTKSYVLEGIPTGDYTVTETGAAVEDFFLTQNPASGEAAVTLEKDAVEELKFTNSYGQEVGDVKVIKVVEGDAEDAPEGTTFELQDAEGNVIDSVTYDEFEEDVNGKMSYTFKDVVVGKYVVVEDEESAQLDGFSLEVEGNDADAEELADEGTLTFTITNTYTALTGTLTIKKNVESKDGLAVPDGATFVITGDLLNGETFNQTVTYADFENGVYVIEDAPAGSYKVIESASSASIKGVTLSITGDNNMAKDLEGNGEVEFEITNNYGLDTASFTIIKTSKKHATPAGATFIISSDSEYFTERTIHYSDFEDNKYPLTDVPVGTYTIVEDEKSAAVSGYELEVEYATGKSIILELGDDVEFEIINTYEKKETPPPPILDTENHDAYIIGYPDGTVQPEGNITRAEVVTIFFRLLTDKSRSQYWETENDFDDVNVENWFNNAVSTMANAGIIKGYEDGKFKPYNNVTRAELATMAARFLTDTTGGTESRHYSDTEDSWAKAEIELASRYGIVNGYDDGTFKPNQAITRAEAMTLINRLLKRNPHEDHLLNNMVRWPDNDDESMWYYAQVQEATNGHTYTWGKDGNGKYEYWKALRKNRDWSALEHEWSTANSK